ncbi:hypothetical protein FOL46_005747 [Perkinsus olseni]|nr:hypothetical protein FOL46_005747 [Perkinsus olseni]
MGCTSSKQDIDHPTTSKAVAGGRPTTPPRKDALDAAGAVSAATTASSKDQQQDPEKLSASSTPPTTIESSGRRRERDEFDFSSGDEDEAKKTAKSKRKGSGVIPPWDEAAERQRVLEERRRRRMEREMQRMQIDGPSPRGPTPAGYAGRMTPRSSTPYAGMASPRRPPPPGGAYYYYHHQHTPRSSAPLPPSPRVALWTPRAGGTPRESRAARGACDAGYGALPHRYLQRTTSSTSMAYYYYQQQSPRGSTVAAATGFTPRAYQQPSPRGGSAYYPPPSPRGGTPRVGVMTPRGRASVVASGDPYAMGTPRGASSSTHRQRSARFMAQMSVGSSFLADFLFTKSPAFVLVFFLVCAALACYVVLLLTSTEDVKTKLLAMPTASLHFFLSKDRKWKQPSDTRIILEEARAFPERAHRKRIIFLRHGESMWNVVFNKGFGPSFPVRLVKCSVKEAELLPTADSLYWDSPISPDGIQQSLRLLSWIEENKKSNKYARLLAGDDHEHTSVMASSNLRRAVSTGMIALSARLLRGEEAPSAGGHRQEQIYVMSALQEVTRNVDGFALTPKKGVPGPSFVEVADPKIKDVVDFYAEHKLNGTFNDGSKPLSSNGLARFREFCDWCFNSSVARDVDCVVAIGHSLYFREFYNAFLPRGVRTPARSNKMLNCGVTSFELVTTGPGK